MSNGSQDIITVEITGDGDIRSIRFPNGQVLNTPQGNMRDAGVEIKNADILECNHYVLLKLRDIDSQQEYYMWHHPFCFFYQEDINYQQSP